MKRLNPDATKRRVKGFVAKQTASLLSETGRGAQEATMQRLLVAQYRQIMAAGGALPSLAETGFGVYSANEEDGMILLIVAVAGLESRQCAEIGAGSVMGANTTNLIVNWGVRALLIEGDQEQLDATKAFLQRHPIDERKVVLRSDWVTAENVNDVFVEHGFKGDLDVLSLDIDGVDYWIWKALDVVQPRILIVEVQDIWGADEAVTVPYRPDFNEGEASGFNNCGASLPAWVKLNRDKGYRLVGATSNGLNAFFLRNDVAPDIFPEVSAAACLDQPWLEGERSRRRTEARKYDWVSV